MTTTIVIAALTVVIVAQAVLTTVLWMERAKRREREARSAAILRAAPDLLFVQSRDGVYRDCYAPSRDRFYVPPEHFIGRNMRDVLPPEVLSQIVPLFTQVWQSDQPVVGGYALDLRGELRHYEVRLVRCGDDEVLSVVRDITDRKRVEAALVESEQRYAMATAAGRVGVWEWDPRTHELYVDPRLKQMLGYATDEISDRLEEWNRLVHPDDRARLLAQLENHVDGRSPAYETECRLQHKDGSLRWFAARGTMLHPSKGNARVVETYSDITEVKQADDALEHAQAEIDRMSRVAAFGEFAASVAHELSQPLTAILMNARASLRWLAQQPTDLSEVSAALGEVVEAGQRADQIIKRNRALFRRHVVDKRLLSINELVREVAMMMGTRLRSQGVKLVTHFDKQLPLVLGDRLELCQVLLNLLGNAIEAMAGVDVPARVITVTTSAPSRDEVCVSVADVGVGLGAVDPQRLFTTGYTTKARGTGVGLSISRTIIEAHGGRMGATPNAGPGATFFFTLQIGNVSSVTTEGETHTPES